MNASPNPYQRPRKRHTVRYAILGAAGAIVVIGVVATAVGGNGQPATPVASPSVPYSGSIFGEPSGAPTASPVPAAPQYTASQQQAINAAQSYLQTEPGFSYQGLIDQLDSPAGNGFSVADATFGVDHVAAASDTTFWDAQAVDSAKSYMQTEPGWSACDLEQQLDSPDGSEFTQAEAAQAVQAVGLGTCS